LIEVLGGIRYQSLENWGSSMTRKAKRLWAVPFVGALILAACGSDSDGDSADTAATGAPAATEAPAATSAPASEPAGSEAPATEAPSDAFVVDVDACADPDAASAPIEGTVKIGSVMPLSGGPAALFKPVADGFQLYMTYANQNGLLDGYTLEATVEDDQYSDSLTGPAVEKLLDQTGVNLFSGIIGTPNNLAVRDLLNEECYPQLNALTGYPGWGDYENYPWTLGALVPYNVEASIYVDKIKELYPDGATLGLFYVNSEFGQAYADAFKELAPDAGIEIVDEQTIEAADANPPTSQITSIASKTPDVVMGVPLGGQCPTFLKELANAKAANPGWEPAVFQGNTCSSQLFLTLAGDAANGVYTSSNLLDIADPKNASVPAVAEFLAAYNAAGITGDPTLAGTGWTIGETTVAVLKQAAASPDGLSRKSIIEAARGLDLQPGLLRPPIGVATSATDGYPAESLQVLQWDVASKTFKEIGEPVTSYEGKTVYQG
jgi:branched-chain amino acid transport system substrate-binding protein